MSLSQLALLGLVVIGCNWQEGPKQNLASRIGDSRVTTIVVPEIVIESTTELGQPIDGWQPISGEIPQQLAIGEIIKLTGTFTVQDGGVAPLTVMIFVSPPNKFGYSDALIRENVHCDFINYPEPNSTFEIDIKLRTKAVRPGPAWITLFAFGKSWDTLKPLAHLSCHLIDQKSPHDTGDDEIIAVLASPE